MEKLNIGNICKGSVPEVFDQALEKVVENFKDVNTPVDQKRKIVLEFVFNPYSDRSGAEISMSCKAGLAGIQTVAGTMFVSQKASSKESYASDPRQDDLFMAEKPAGSTPS